MLDFEYLRDRESWERSATEGEYRSTERESRLEAKTPSVREYVCVCGSEWRRCVCENGADEVEEESKRTRERTRERERENEREREREEHTHKIGIRILSCRLQMNQRQQGRQTLKSA